MDRLTGGALHGDSPHRRRRRPGESAAAAATTSPSGVDALKAAGIKRIDGRVVGVDDAYEEPRPGFAWSWDDLGYSTGASFGALNLAENRLTVTVTPGAFAGATTSLAFNVEAQDLPITNRSVTGAGRQRDAGLAGNAAGRERFDDRRLCAGGRVGGGVEHLGRQPDGLVRSRAAAAADRIGHRCRRSGGRCGRCEHRTIGGSGDRLHVSLASPVGHRAAALEGEHQPVWRGGAASERCRARRRATTIRHSKASSSV
jgi:hypothetical protein